MLWGDMKTTYWVGLAGIVALSVAGYAAWDSIYSPKAQAIQAVKRSLNDPNSAIFENIQHSQKTGATCGNVNAKNRMGGYVGMTAFIVDGDGGVTLAPAGATDSGPTEQRLKAINAKLSFLERLEACYAENNSDEEVSNERR